MKLSARIWKKVPESGVKSEHGYASFVPNNELEAFRAGFGNFQILPSSCVPTIRQWRQWKTKEGQINFFISRRSSLTGLSCQAV